MNFVVLLQLMAAVASVSLAAGILARDRELAPNRLIASFLLCNAWWASCEFYLIQTSDPVFALINYKWMVLGWMPLGLLCMHGSFKLSAMPEHPVARLIPLLYAAVAVFAVLSVSTDLVISDAKLVSPGHWRATFGPAFAPAYALTVGPMAIILVCWKGLMRAPGRDGAHRLARVIFFGMSSAVISGTVTSVAMPLLGFDAFGITTLLVAVVGFMTASTLRHYGHSLISPEAFAREIFDTLEDGVVVLSQDGIVRDANRALIRMLGAHEGGVAGREITRWIPGFPADFENLDDSTFMEMRNRDGEIFPVVVSGAAPLAKRGRSIGHILLIRDRREVVLLQRQLAVSGRLAAVGDLSKSISASIHGPAMATRLQLERLASDWQAMANYCEAKPDCEACRDAISEGVELIAECIEGVDRVSAIVQEVGNFSADREPAELECHSLSEIAENAVRVARVQAPANVRIELRLDADVMVLGNQSELERVVANLVVNAFHALDGTDRRVANLAVAVGAQGERALLHVEDDGCGIAPESLERIFDPFFTTKPVGKGTGLGLAISYHIVRKHDGQIRVSSIQDRGTSVAVELPRFQQEADRANA